ncbi:MAG: enolase superfamily enzyme related to L-alanine-DL-glutamate epimerase [Planctomycetota bacterium]|nr:enolase superfamily enzyme related to L-alanine-DL-glutamate epimerase [Planctomycetota bacterium]
MTVRSIDLYHVAVPLKSKIKHASHERTVSDNLVVRVVLASGQEGYGEGVPRPYVTGESIESTFAALSSFDVARAMGQASDFSSAVVALTKWTLPQIADDPRGMFGNAARCALELAILDAYGRASGRSLGEAIPILTEPGLALHGRPQPVRYSGAITADSEKKERISAFKMWVYGFAQVKIKVGVAGQDDPARMGRLRKILGRRMDLRIDANEAWRAGELLDRVRPLKPYRPTALEQPVPHAEVRALTDLRPQLGIPVMLDESLCGFPDAVLSAETGTADLFNVRLSKCGGIIPSLRIAALAGRSRLGVQLGCHPGETGLLSAAGRHFASRVAGLRYVEGSYDRHVIGANVIAEDITFGYGGRAKPLSGPGLGVTVDPEALRRMTVSHKEIRFD